MTNDNAGTLNQDLVSCIMPTADRRTFVPAAIDYFLAQTYPHKELIILDDGKEPVADLVPDNPSVRYFHQAEGLTLGAKRNRLCELARGDIIAHWDDDDWYAPRRLERQMAVLKETGKSLCGIERLFYFDTLRQTAFQYTYKGHNRHWLSLLCYHRNLWQANPFPNIQVGSDTRFLWHVDQRHMAVMENDGLNVCFIHGTNVSPKRTGGQHWQALPVERLRTLLGDDWKNHPGLPPGQTPVAHTASEKRTIKERVPAGAEKRPEKDWTVIIPTYNRPQILGNLLKDLVREQADGLRLDVRVYDDASTCDNTDQCNLVDARGWQWCRVSHHHGKTKYWQLIDRAFGDMALCPAGKMVLFIHDDYRLDELFFSKASEIWQSIDDPCKLALTVAVDPDRRNSRCWTGVDPEKLGRVWKTQWVDGAFIARPRFFSSLQYRVPPVRSNRWHRDPSLSSGVGRNLSVHLANAGYHLYRTDVNLAHHQDGPSMLHPKPHVDRETKAPPGKRETHDPKEKESPPKSRAGAKKWVVVIMTYERPLRLLDLLNDIRRESSANHTIDVRVYDDASRMDYGAPLALLENHRWRFTRAPRNHGKHLFWQWISRAYTELKGLDADTRVVFLQDDVRLCRHFFDKAAQQWEAIDDPRKATLTLLLDSQREGRRCWTAYSPHRSGNVWQTQWVDQLFMADRRFLEAIDYRIEPISRYRWQVNPDLSSGVGQSLSNVLHRSGWQMYCVDESLIAHVEQPSLMNGKVRKRETMQTVRFADGTRVLERLVRPRTVTASLASVARRRALLQQVIKDLVPQVDLLRVYLNDHEEIPDFLSHPKIEVALGKHHGDLKDTGKFFWNGKASGYYLSCDDDLLYPQDYVARLLAAVERFEKQAVVGFHGVMLHSRVRSYYRDRTVYHFSQALPEDRSVHIIGTGCAAWHSDLLKTSRADYPQPLMTDIWLGRLCQEKKIPMVAAAHSPGWLRAQSTDDSIFNCFVHKDRPQTEVINTLLEWRLHPVQQTVKIQWPVEMTG